MALPLLSVFRASASLFVQDGIETHSLAGATATDEAVTPRTCCGLATLDQWMIKAQSRVDHSLAIPVAAIDSAAAFGFVTLAAHRVIHSGCGTMAAG